MVLSSNNFSKDNNCRNVHNEDIKNVTIINNYQIVNYEAPQTNRLHSAELLQIEDNTSGDQEFEQKSSSALVAIKTVGLITGAMLTFFLPKK